MYSGQSRHEVISILLLILLPSKDGLLVCLCLAIGCNEGALYYKVKVVRLFTFSEYFLKRFIFLYLNIFDHLSQIGCLKLILAVSDEFNLQNYSTQLSQVILCPLRGIFLQHLIEM